MARAKQQPAEPDPNNAKREQAPVPPDAELLKLQRRVVSARARYDAEIATATQLFSKSDNGNLPDLHGENYSRWNVQHQRLREAFKEYRAALDAYIEANRSKLKR